MKEKTTKFSLNSIFGGTSTDQPALAAWGTGRPLTHRIIIDSNKSTRGIIPTFLRAFKVAPEYAIEDQERQSALASTRNPEKMRRIPSMDLEK